MSAPAETFIARWSQAKASERANAQQFLIELADLLEVPRPSNSHDEGYSFEFPVKIPRSDGTFTEGRMDLYRRTAFVLEAKQFADQKEEQTPLAIVAEEAAIYKTKKTSSPVRGTGAWDDAMLKARGQAERYARSLPATEPNPPFLLVVDVGHSIEVFADFTQAGKSYLPFPDPRSFRIRLTDLADADVRARLRRIWLDPLSLDPAKVSAAVTREIAGYLAVLAASLENAGHAPRLVAEFLTRCLFCMFAEDVGLLPKEGFRGLLESLREQPEGFVPKLKTLFGEMQTGTDFSVILNRKLLRFNGGLFEDASVLPLDAIQLGILIKASTMQWKDVEPAIFGTLLERALDPDERHSLGAHYTPRAYVERLVLPTVVEPLREEWQNVRTAAVVHAQASRIDEARAEIRKFHDRLCKVTVLDPACGSGNFLYVTLEHLKRLEGEVLDVAAGFGENMLLDLETHTVDPHQFLGIELNPRAASIAEMVLWIGYLQWHFRTRGASMPAEPVLKKFRNIECRDAVLAWDGDPVPLKDEIGNTITVWDRKSKKTDSVTGREIPDESKRASLLSYPNARPAEWPKADFIVGNPPFLGPARMREDLGDGYAETLRATYPDVPESSDFVMYWWHKAAVLVGAGQAGRFGFITTNSLRQTFNRRVIEMHRSAGVPHAPSGQDARGPFFDPLADVDASKHKLPHWNQSDCFCFVTWRLDDALPHEKLEEWNADREIWLAEHPKPWIPDTEEEFHKTFSSRLDEWLDAGYGSCLLRAPSTRKLLADAIGHFDGQRYELVAYVIMPNHVHVLLKLKADNPIEKILHSWKSFSAKAINKALGRTGTLWQHESWDRLIRSGSHFDTTLAYIQDNPKKARLPDTDFTLIQRSAGVPPASSSKSAQNARAPLSLSFAIPDHPWVDTKDGAAVRIAMTVGMVTDKPGELHIVKSEKPQDDGSAFVTFATQTGRIAADLTIGANVSDVSSLHANEGLVSRGVQTIGEGFVITPAKADQLGLGVVHDIDRHMRHYLNGRDITDVPRGVYCIDLYGLTADEARLQFSAVYQHLLTRVKPERDQSRRDSYREKWWIIGEPQPALRTMIAGLPRFIASPVTAKHRFFVFLKSDILPDQALNVFGSEDAFVLGVLSSRIHIVFALAAGGTLEDRPRYNNSRCFDPFPFPDCDEETKSRIRAIAEELDAHRKRVQALHPGLTLTGMYNVLEALRKDHALTPKEQIIHEKGLISVLRQLHDQLDAAVFAAYGWTDRSAGVPPASPSLSGQDARAPFDQEILTRLVALNAERAEEEKNGKVRWLRPDYQTRNAKSGIGNEQSKLALPVGEQPASIINPSLKVVAKLPWPKSLTERVQAIESALKSSPGTPAQLAKRFSRAKEEDVAEILETLVTLGRITKSGDVYA